MRPRSDLTPGVAATLLVAYSGDNEWTEVLSEAARDADLFVCETYS